MLLDQRRTEILQIIEKQGFVSLNELVDRLGVSESTLRRDLEHLDGIGQIRRTRGGAAYIGESLTPFEERSETALLQKQRLAKAVADDVQPGETVLLDGGTTTLEVARCLMGKSLQVVTNSLPIASLLFNQSSIELILIGGYLYPRTGVALGPLADLALQQLQVSRLIMSVGGITDRGFFNSNSLLVEAERQMIRVAGHVVVVADSGKLGRAALAHLCDFSEVDELVLDSGASPEWCERLASRGLPPRLVSVESPGS